MADTSPQNLINLTTCYDCAPLYSLYELGLLALIANNTGGGGGAGSQIVGYTGIDPNMDGVTPGNINAPAIAVKPGSTTWTWDTVNHVWT